jgi:hypothetical protein
MKIFTWFTVILLVVIGISAAILVNGFVISTLWAWFLVPLGLPQIGIIHAAGISILASYPLSIISIKIDRIMKNTKGAEETIPTILIYLLVPVMALFLGWILTLLL